MADCRYTHDLHDVRGGGGPLGVFVAMQRYRLPHAGPRAGHARSDTH